MAASSGRIAILAAAALAVATPALAQDKREREVARRLQRELGTLQREKSQLVTEKTQLEEKLKAAAGEAEQLKADAAGAAGRAAHVQRELDAARKALETGREGKEALEQKLADAEQRLQALAARERGTAAVLAARDGEVRALAAKLAAEQQRYGACGAANAKLYLLGGELLERYQKKGCMSSLLEQEPFTQIKRVELENLVEDYRDKLDAARIPAAR